MNWDDACDALARLEAGGEDAAERRALGLVVRDYIAELERVANQRGEKLRQIVEDVTEPQGRVREIVGRFAQEGRVFVMQVPSYDAAWLEDLWVTTDEPTSFRLRPAPGECFSVERPMTLTIEDASDAGESGDILLTLKATGLFEALCGPAPFNQDWVQAPFVVFFGRPRESSQPPERAPR